MERRPPVTVNLSRTPRYGHAVSRRSTPELIDAAQRAGVRARLTGEGVLPEMADAWIVAWETHEPRSVEERGGAYWTADWEWIAAERQRRSGT